MLIAASIVAATLGRPPQPYSEGVRLPGRIPASEQDLQNTYKFSYFSGDPAPGQTRLFVSLTVSLNKDGTYELVYNAVELGPANEPGKGLNVFEKGKYSLSGDVLLLEPQSVRKDELQTRVIHNQAVLPNENHVWIVQVEKGRLHVAGRCANYQIEPECQMSANIWFSMVEELRLRRGFVF